MAKPTLASAAERAQGGVLPKGGPWDAGSARRRRGDERRRSGLLALRSGPGRDLDVALDRRAG